MPDIVSYLRSFRHLTHLPDGDGELLQRFRVKRDELAFTTLVQRHGPMVLGIAERILGRNELLDDVFQAIFLVLAKRGRHLETRPSVAGWLVQVARRTALQARSKSARQARHEQQAAAMASISIDAEPAEAVSRRELAQLLDAELARLPSKYRTPLVLYHLEGQTKEETARQLGWPVGSVSGRLVRGRKLLQARLLRRGIVPVLAATIFTMPAANAHLPSLLIQATTLLATHVVHQTSKVPASPAVVLAQGVMTSMFMNKVKYAAAILLVLGLCLGTGAWAWQEKGNETASPVLVPKNEAKQPSLQEQIQGEWFDGSGYWVFRNNEVAIKLGIRTNPDFKKHDLFQINESTRPAKILFAGVRGVIKISEGKLYLNLAKSPDATDIPEDFQESPTRNTFILNRVTDYDRLEGTWRREERNPVTDEIETAYEMIFKKNMYVERMFVKGSIREDPPKEYAINENAVPKQLDLGITKASDLNSWYSNQLLKNKDKFDRDVFLSTLARELGQGKYRKHELAIYELKDNEFKYVVTGSLPFELINNEFVPNFKSPLNQRASSFATAKGNVLTFKRVERSLKDTTNAKPETIVDPRIKPPTGTPGETPSTELLDLRQQRLKLAQERMKLWRESRFTGSPPFDDLGAISQQILDATLATATDKPARLRAMEDHLKVLLEMEKHYEQLFQNGGNTKYTLLAHQLRRIEFEIQLQELKEKR